MGGSNLLAGLEAGAANSYSRARSRVILIIYVFQRSRHQRLNRAKRLSGNGGILSPKERRSGRSFRRSVCKAVDRLWPWLCRASWSALGRSSAMASSGPLLSGCMGCASRLSPIRSPPLDGFALLRCLHLAALIFDPWPWLLVGPGPILSPLVAGAGLLAGPALLRASGLCLRSLFVLPYPPGRCVGG